MHLEALLGVGLLLEQQVALRARHRDPAAQLRQLRLPGRLLCTSPRSAAGGNPLLRPSRPPAAVPAPACKHPGLADPVSDLFGAKAAVAPLLHPLRRALEPTKLVSTSHCSCELAKRASCLPSHTADLQGSRLSKACRMQVH